MKRMVGIVIIAVLACALFLVPHASAAYYCELSIVDSGVVPSTGNVTDTVTYYAKVKNMGKLNCYHVKVKLKLTYGVNEDNMDCNGLGPTEGTYDFDGGEIKTILFEDIRLKRLTSCDGEFKNFTEGNLGWKWEKCWYRIEGSYDGNNLNTVEKWGTPILTYTIEIFKNNNVTQNETYKDLSFDYFINVSANKEDNNIRLLVYNRTNPTSDKFEPKGEPKSYEPDEGQKQLTWTVNLTLDNLGKEYEGRYKFVGSYNESPPPGSIPPWHIGPVIEEKFYEPKWSYNKTINKLSFDYEVTAWVNMIEDNNITLEVTNFHTGEWEPKGNMSYTNVSNNQTLKWKNISLTCDNFDGLRGKYRFVGSYGSSSDIIGPTIEENFSDLSVTPKEGTNNDTFTYNVTVNANICDKIELQVWNYTLGDWDSKDTPRDYIIPDKPDKNQTLAWHNISLNSHQLNSTGDRDGKYRFVGFCKRVNSSIKEGPFWVTNLTWDKDNISVVPKRGLWNAEYKYCIRMYAERNLSVELVVYYPSSKKIAFREIKNYTKKYNFQTICWNNTQPFKRECEGDASYMFIFYRKGVYINETAEHVGPYVGIAEFENSSVKPEIGTCETIFNYSVKVNATKEGDVYLEIQCPDSVGWHDVGPHYEYSPPGFKPFNWDISIKPPCDKCGIAKYRFRFEPKKIINVSKTYSNESYGPEIIKEDFKNFSVYPREGTNYTSFNFSVSFLACKQEKMTLQASLNKTNWTVVNTTLYTNIGNPETINFREKAPFDNFSVVYWKCNGSVNESEIIETKWNISLNWINTSFSPPEGWWNDTFDFSVNLSANVPGDVEFKVKCKDWKSARNKSYSNASKLQTRGWENVSICNEPYEGNTSYRFIFHWGNTQYPSPIYNGPEVFIRLNISLEKDTVEPEKGVYYNFKEGIYPPFYIFNDTNNTTFNFTIDVTADKNTTLKLVLLDPCGNNHTINEKECEYNTTPHQPLKCSWTMIELPSGQAGKWNYTFSYYDTRLYYDTGDGWNMSNKTFEGPEIIAVFENYTLDPEPPISYRKLCNVTVWMNGTEKMNVTLEAYNVDPYSSDYNNWTRIETEHYEPSGEKCLRWSIDTFVVPFDKLRLK